MVRSKTLPKIHSVADLENMFQANYEVACITLNLNMFLFAKVLLLQALRGSSKNVSAKLSGIFKEIMVKFLLSLHAKTIVCFVYRKNPKFYGKGLQQRSYLSKVVKYMIKKPQNYINSDNIGDFIAKFENAFVC